ncbi:MAG: PaaI family thioesterase [Deltaproteobacteria bacterium]|nr:PaaI family thioesterase [Deltaproteobacteria bacterium]
MTLRPLPALPDHLCFACGRANPHGLQMEFLAEEAALVSRLRIPAHMCGWQGVAHGGIVATVLDEVMGKAAIYLLERLILTRYMELRFFKPVRVERPIEARAELELREGEQRAVMRAELRDEQGELCASARGDFVMFTPEAFRARGFDEQLVADFERELRLWKDVEKPVP